MIEIGDLVKISKNVNRFLVPSDLDAELIGVVYKIHDSSRSKEKLFHIRILATNQIAGPLYSSEVKKIS